MKTQAKNLQKEYDNVCSQLNEYEVGKHIYVNKQMLDGKQFRSALAAVVAVEERRPIEHTPMRQWFPALSHILSELHHHYLRVEKFFIDRYVI